jgi:hypothetical protein
MSKKPKAPVGNEGELVNLDVSYKAEGAEKKVAEPMTLKRKATVLLIYGGEIVLSVDGNGERIPYSDKLHSTLKAGDTIYID